MTTPLGAINLDAGAVPPQLEPDEDQIDLVVDLLFGRCSETIAFTAARAFSQNDRSTKPAFGYLIQMSGSKRGHLKKRLKELAHQAADWNLPTVFAPVLSATFVSGPRARAADVFEIVAIPFDLDTNPDRGLAMLRAILGEPSIVLETGG